LYPICASTIIMLLDYKCKSSANEDPEVFVFVGQFDFMQSTLYAQKFDDNQVVG
jgi:hypothetical protein